MENELSNVVEETIKRSLDDFGSCSSKIKLDTIEDPPTDVRLNMKI